MLRKLKSVEAQRLAGSILMSLTPGRCSIPYQSSEAEK